LKIDGVSDLMNYDTLTCDWL